MRPEQPLLITRPPPPPQATAVKDAPMGSAAPPPPPDKPAHDVVAGAIARAASQSTIHPLDTMKVRMQTNSLRQGTAQWVSNRAVLQQGRSRGRRRLHNVALAAAWCTASPR